MPVRPPRWRTPARSTAAGQGSGGARTGGLPGPGRGSAIALLALALACGSSKQPLGSLGADCLGARDAACASGTCLVLDSSTAYCSQVCQKQADCPDGYLCLPGGSAGTLCQARGAGGVCASDDDCPAGLRCDAGPGRCYVPVTRSACGSCTSDKQCGAGGSCHAEGTDRYCATACGAGDACPAGYSCKPADGGKRCLPTGGSCRGGRPLCGPCSGDLECGKSGDLCVRNLISDESFCAVNCASSNDCPKNFSCVDLSGKGGGPSQCVPDSGTCQGYCDSTDPATVKRECGLGASCDLANRACKRATDGSLCAGCSTDDDCTKFAASSRCLVNRTPGSPFQGERFCGKDCTQGACTGSACLPDASKCDAGFACVGIGTNGTWPFQCAPARGSCQGGFGRLGDACDRHGPDDCLTAICAQFGDEKRCTVSCSADADCGDARWRCCAASGTSRYDCTKAPSGGGGVCAPVGGSFGDDCSPGHAPCQEGYCLDIGTAQLCTRGCDPAAAGTCPNGFSCQSGRLVAADGTSTTSVRVCFPDGGGAVGSACTFGPAACTSHLCVKKDSGNVCTKECLTATDCPNEWTCGEQEVMPAGQKKIVCLPPGTGP